MDNPSQTQAAIGAEVRLITSAKGGVGKSTVCANLGAALAEDGNRVLLIDCDIVNRCLDLMLGLEDEAIFGIRDVCAGSVTLDEAVHMAPTQPNLFLLPGSLMSEEDIAAVTQSLPALIEEARNSGYDHILIDTPGGLHDILFSAARVVSEAIIVSSAQTTAIRSAEQTAALLCEQGLSSQRLIVNQFMAAEALLSGSKRLRSRKRTRAANEAAIALISTVDTVSLSLLGVIPFDASLWDAQNKGELIDAESLSDTPFAAAHRNIARRICGRSVPLFSAP